MEDRELRTAAGARRLGDELRATRTELAELRRTVARIGVCLALGLVAAGLVVPLWSVPALHDAAVVGDPDAGEPAPMRLLSGGVVLLGLADAGSTHGVPSSLGGVLGATCAVMLTIYAVAEEPTVGWGSPSLVAGVGLAVWLVRTPTLRHA